LGKLFFMLPYLRAKQRCVGTGFSLKGDSLTIHFIPSGAHLKQGLIDLLTAMTFMADKQFQGAWLFPFRTIISSRDDKIVKDYQTTNISEVDGVCTVAFDAIIECISGDRKFRAKAWKASPIPED